MSIIFLDIDGVVCTRLGAGWSRKGKPIGRLGMRRPTRAIDRRAIDRLNDLCLRASATIVVISSWRIDRDVRSILVRAGFTGMFHPDWRTDWDGPLRADEIRRWLDLHGWPPHVVIDDWADELKDFMDSLVRTDNYSGLSDADVACAAALLAQQDSARLTANGDRAPDAIFERGFISDAL